MGLHNALRKAAGLFVEVSPDGVTPEEGAVTTEREGFVGDTDRTRQRRGDRPVPTKTVDQIVREAEGPNLDEVKVPDSPPNIVAPDGRVDFVALYQQAALPPTPLTAEQVLEMLSALPAELPLDTKRKTVNVSLNAMGKALGATPETIVADASRKVAALAAYAENVSKETAQFVVSAEAQIAALQAEIEEKRKAIEAAKSKQQQVEQSCEAEGNRLDEVLEFFSLDVPPSKYAPQGREKK